MRSPGAARFLHLSLAESGPAAQVSELGIAMGKIGGAALMRYRMYYPPVLSPDELSFKLQKAERENLLPERIYAVYNAAGELPPAPDDVPGAALKEKYAFTGRTEFPGVAVDEWIRKTES